MRIALDAMGGDHGLGPNVAGALAAVGAAPDLTVVLVGDEAQVSAGNTGAVVAGGLFLRRFLKCVHRPGIATVMPTAKGRCVIMDVGANVHPKARHLLEYGVMGGVFAKHMLGVEK